MTVPFAAGGSWLRCQLHAHTTNSDGEATAAGLAAHYARAGYDVLAITDHHHVTHHAEDGILILPSAELTATPTGEPEVDVLAFGIDEAPGKAFASIPETARWIVAAGGVAYLAHPYWSGSTADQYLGAPDLSGIEVYNGGSEITQGNGLSVVHWDEILQRGGRCLAIATDDSHYTGQDSRLGWTLVRAAERSREAVLAALREGSFYASSGAEIVALELDDDGVEVRTSPASSIALRSGPWDGGQVNAAGHLMHYRARVLERTSAGAIVAARFERPEFWDWARIEVTGSDGGRAWSNPFALTRAEGPTTR